MIGVVLESGVLVFVIQNSASARVHFEFMVVFVHFRSFHELGSKMSPVL